MFGRKPSIPGTRGGRSLFRRKRAGVVLPTQALKRNPAIRPSTKNDAIPAAAAIPAKSVIGAPAAVRRSRSRLALAISNAVMACTICLFWPAAMGTVDHSRNDFWGLDQTSLKATLSDALQRNERPGQLYIKSEKVDKTGNIHYNIDPELQAKVEGALEQFRPDYGMVVALDARSGDVIAMADIRRDGQTDHNMNLKATYPAASVFKTVTAAAAIDMGKANAATVVPYNGKTTTLYKKNVLQHKNNKWTRHQSLENSFSKSVNTVFARLGIYTIGGDKLLDYADRFGFNQAIPTDLPLDSSTIELNPEDDWSVAEVASGYTRGTNISPIHGAMIAATVVNDGLMPTPRIIDAVTDEHGIILYEAEPQAPNQVISREAAKEMRKLMQETVRSGSAAKSFRNFPHKTIEAGGKTGSLTGFHPKGKYDWFVGYADDGQRPIAYAVLCINKDYWYVKSSHLARLLIEDHYQL